MQGLPYMRSLLQVMTKIHAALSTPSAMKSTATKHRSQRCQEKGSLSAPSNPENGNSLESQKYKRCSI